MNIQILPGNAASDLRWGGRFGCSFYCSFSQNAEVKGLSTWTCLWKLLQKEWMGIFTSRG